MSSQIPYRLSIRLRPAVSATPSPSPSQIFDASDRPSTPLSEAGDRNTNFNDLSIELRRRIWEITMQPRVVEMRPCRLKKTRLELYEEMILERPNELPHYTFQQLGPLARERCLDLQQKYTKENCGRSRLKEIQRLPILVNKAIKVLVKTAGEDPNYLFDLESIISAFLSVNIPLDYMPCILEMTTLELIIFVKLTFPSDVTPDFKYEDDSDQEYDYKCLSRGIWGLSTETPTPNILLVCRESYEVGIRHYKRCFLPYQSAPGAWFDLERDTLIFRSDGNEGGTPDWAYGQAWLTAYGHFEKTLRDCCDYTKLAMELKNVSVIVHPSLKALYHGYYLTLCLGKVHEMFLCLNKCSMMHTLYTRNDDDVEESALLPLLDCAEAWESYNAITPRRWQFTRKPSMQVTPSLDDLPAEYFVLDIGDNGLVCASWTRENDKGVFREFKFFDDIVAARKFAARSVKLVVKKKPVVPVPRIILNTKFKARMKEMECSAESSTGDTGCVKSNMVRSEVASTASNGSKSDYGTRTPGSHGMENNSNPSRRQTRSMTKLWSGDSEAKMTE
ncbi:hypothetical protein HYALB_00007295 [Hymenoscyphus albidus]|uniref:2EXR domain-containing protein n=1 Tax=Hymenoscyphus albidus TaxID=595503 RepID=A0A9N9LWU6_9HELO|nr:hypothetical protein HYALB_00007295 [Hymenoscyphus albidus]